jgi:hypothetical protein
MFFSYVPPRDKRLNRTAVPESSLDAICLRMTNKAANAFWNFGSGIGSVQLLEVQKSAASEDRATGTGAAYLNSTLGLNTKETKISANLSESKHCVASY